MPSLTNTLEQLSALSQQIHTYSQCNAQPSGPYTTAYLHSSVLNDLIRDGSDAERRLFKFIGENENSIKKVEKREGPVTPLKALQSGKAKGGTGEIEVVLRTAARLVDDYRPMPRARNHINALAEQHDRQLQKIAELEKLIAELNDPSTSSLPQSPAQAAPKVPPKPTLSPDEAIAAEEESLRSLEAYLKANRPNPHFISPQKQDPPSTLTQSTRTPRALHQAATEGDNDNDDESPVRESRPSIFQSTQSRTPAKTPIREYPHIANSLVAGPTPHRPLIMHIDRFSPLKNIGTPGARGARARGSIFGLRASVAASAARKTFATLSPEKSAPTALVAAEEEEEEGEMETEMVPMEGQVELAPEIPASPAGLQEPEQAEAETEPAAEMEEEEDDQATPTASPVKLSATSPIKRAEIVHGVKVDDDQVVAAISRIETTFPELVGQSNSEGPEKTEQVINHLYHLSTSDPESTEPVPREIIYQSFLCLLVLQSPGLSVPMSQVKESFGADMRARGRGMGEETDGAKIAWKLVGKKTMRIDRSGAGGPAGSLRFTS